MGSTGRQLCVEVVEARGLPSLTQALEGGGAPRLYIVLKLGKQRASTRLTKATKAPSWRERFIFQLKTEDFDGTASTDAAAGATRDEAHLVCDLYACDAHMDLAEEQMAATVRGDGRRANGVDDERQAVLATSIPMPIRSLGRTVILLASSKLHSSRNGLALPVEYMDITPRRGHRSMPLFTLGQLGVKVYIRDEEGAGDGAPPLMETARRKDADAPRQAPASAPTTAPAPPEKSADQAEAIGEDEESEGEEEGTFDEETVVNAWKPPGSIDWRAISVRMQEPLHEPKFRREKSPHTLKAETQIREWSAVSREHKEERAGKGSKPGFRLPMNRIAAFTRTTLALVLGWYCWTVLGSSRAAKVAVDTLNQAFLSQPCPASSRVILPAIPVDISWEFSDVEVFLSSNTVPSAFLTWVPLVLYVGSIGFVISKVFLV